MNTFEMPTYGEAYTFLKLSMRMVNGEWVTVKPPKHRPRMSRKDAAKYYNRKLNEYWKKAH